MSYLKEKWSEIRGALNGRRLLRICVVLYGVSVILSVVLAHALAILFPFSDISVRLIAPVEGGLEFVDEHWKAALLVLALFFTPWAGGLLNRLSEFNWAEKSFKLYEGGVHEKPHNASRKDVAQDV